MKINEHLRTYITKREIGQNVLPTDSHSFQELIQKQESKLYLDQLNRLMAELDEAGSRLSKSRNFQDLSKFKSIVKRFIRQAVDYGMSLKESNSWDFNGNKRTFKIIEEIDQKLLALTDDILAKEKEGVDILGKIGEIKGLLINLYT
ncbi:YaaR family protein [Bacillus alveayuensis]|jgi:uncharacterized protein|uniref:Uncharacterized protein YaaR (DUF327 family) n=1 Tax=Aeribacillus alveayuensis TaxID=279215 RepID=A0ABT9VR40_9BACI|nr:YaaR family protein [Bacillus alveayuensis]MDQ0163436.1 uncharacterized protein YaaR (DUF327 family) [Bacillus alveayuensis]